MIILIFYSKARIFFIFYYIFIKSPKKICNIKKNMHNPYLYPKVNKNMDILNN